MVRSYTALSAAHSAYDPWKAYPDLDAKLYYNKHLQVTHLIPFANIVSHAAAYVYTPEGVGKECIVLKGLDRVSCFPTIGILTPLNQPISRADRLELM